MRCLCWPSTAECSDWKSKYETLCKESKSASSVLDESRDTVEMLTSQREEALALVEKEREQCAATQQELACLQEEHKKVLGECRYVGI